MVHTVIEYSIGPWKWLLPAAMAWTCLVLPARARAADTAVPPPPTVALAGFRTAASEKGPSGDGTGLVKGLEDSLGASLSESGQVVLVERTQVQKVLEEQKLGASGLVDSSTAARLGRLLKAQVVVEGRIRALERGEYLAVVRAIQTLDARVLWAAQAQGSVTEIVAQTGALAAELLEALRQAKLIPEEAPAERRPLQALRRHERAVALRAQKAYEDSVAEELAALELDAGMEQAEEGLIQALAEGGFPHLARAEAQACLAQKPDLPKDAAIRKFAALSAPPPPAAPTEDRKDSFKAVARRKVVDWVSAQAAPGMPEAISAGLDEFVLKVDLAAQYGAEGRGRMSREVTKEALKRIWSLRALDPAALRARFWSIFAVQLTPAEKVIELLAEARTSDRGLLGSTYWRGQELSALLAQTAGQGLPEGAQLPLTVYRVDVPILSQVALPKFDDTFKVASYRYLFQVNWERVPLGARLWSADLLGKPKRSWSDIFFHPVPQAWDPDTATTSMARAGVPWMRRPFWGDERLTLLQALTDQWQRTSRAQGLEAADFFDKEQKELPKMVLRLKVTFPPGSAPGQLQPDHEALLERAVYVLLKGEKDRARETLERLRKTVQQEEEGSEFKALLERILLLCGGKP